MKLVLCVDCWDVFKLSPKDFRQCECGKVVGRYVNNLEAEVSENAVSIGIGNGSLERAVSLMREAYRENPKSARQFYLVNTPILAWVRPNSGPGNPHTTELREIP